MPVSTRSHINVIQEQNEDQGNQENSYLGNRHHQLRNPHHGLKEKMKALTQLYEQQKQLSSALKNASPKPHVNRFSTHPSVDLLGGGGSCNAVLDGNKKKPGESDSHVMRENVMPNFTVTRTYVLPMPPPSTVAVEEDAKENVAVVAGGNNEKAVAFSCPRRGMVPTNMARKLSLGSSVVAPGREPIGVSFGGAGGGEEGVVNNPATVDGGMVKVSNMGSRILVFVRLRPLSKKEIEAGSRSCVRIVNGKEVYLTEFTNENDYLSLKRLRGRHFTFDASFPDTSSQLEVYSASTSELVEAVLQGRNGSVFCYGATGAGKTFTMLGTFENPGIMVLAIKDLFNKVRQRSCDGKHVVHLSYLEVYNETVRDLLSPGRPLVLREDKQGIVATGLTQYRAYSADEVMALLQQGNRNRTTEPTRANETSSRSHAILQVMVEYRVKDDSNNVMNRVGKLSLIDLAGSERALATDQRTLRSLEGANINRSLLALSSCINALVEGKKHIPYRNSKLTQLLKDSLGGACNTIMIANISPSNLSFGETQNTLHWADRAKEIRTKACEANKEVLHVPESEADQAKLLFELQKENRELRVQLARQQQKLLTIQAQSLAAASPTPSSISSILSTPPSSCRPMGKQKPMPSFLTGNCFTPESKKKGAEETVKELKQAVKKLEAAMEKMKTEHALQMKQKDDYIREISQKGVKTPVEGGLGAKRVVTRSSLRPKKAIEDELKSPSHRFLSPAPTAKKRSFWDITTTNSPSLNGRKTRSHVAKEHAAAPSMLLQPGFARQRPESSKQ